MAAPRYSLARVVGLTVVVGAIGLATHVAAEALGWEYPSVGASIEIGVSRVAMVAVLFFAFKRFEGRRPDARDLGWAREDTPADERRSRTPKALLGLLGVGVLGFVISKIPALGSSATDAGAYGNATKVGIGVLLLEVLIRYPLTVFAEESFFRGWLQPRLPWAAPVLSGVLWAGSHFQQASTIASLVPLGIGLGIIRWWTGDVRTTGLVHYVSNVAFFVSNYR